jgi:hypothetical protein
MRTPGPGVPTLNQRITIQHAVQHFAEDYSGRITSPGDPCGRHQNADAQGRASVLILLRTHQVQERSPDRKCEEIIDDIEHDEFSHLTPDFCFVGRADVQQE